MSCANKSTRVASRPVATEGRHRGGLIPNEGTCGDYDSNRQGSSSGSQAASRPEPSARLPPYLVILALASYLPIQPIVAVKAISILGDLALAGVGAAIVARLRPQSFRTPVAAFGAVFLLPTVVMNSGVWGQCDSLYAACCLAAVLALIDRRALAASAWFGLAFGFKLQAIFLLPLLIAVVIVNRHRWWSLLAAPATFFASLMPALIAGRSLASQLMVYPLQITDSSGVGGTVGGARPPGGGGGGRPGGGGGFTSTTARASPTTPRRRTPGWPRTRPRCGSTPAWPSPRAW